MRAAKRGGWGTCALALLTLLLAPSAHAQASTPPPLPAPTASTPSAPQPQEGDISPNILSASVATIPASTVARPTGLANIALADVGHLNLIDSGTFVRQEFTLTNVTQGLITITRLQTGCGCVTAVLGRPASAGGAGDAAAGTSGGPEFAAPMLPGGGLARLAPGASATVTAIIDLTRVPAGTFEKAVRVYVADRTSPVALLRVAGMLEASISIEPRIVDFGEIAAGDTPTLTVTVHADARLAPNAAALPALTSADPLFLITPVGAPTVQPATPSDTGSGGRRQVIATYRVALAPSAPIGPRTAVLRFAVPASPPGSHPQATDVWSSAAAIAVATVQGSIAVHPQKVGFGILAPGVQATRQVLLTGPPGPAWDGVSATSDAPWLSVTVISLPSTPADKFTINRKVIDIHANPGALHGILTATIQVTLGLRQTLTLPVTAYVRTSAPAPPTTGTAAR